MAQDLSTIRERTVHLLAYHDGGRKSLSGFAVAEDLVLTCAHDLVDAVRIEAHAVGADRVVVAEVVWKRTDLDVAILRAPGLGVSIHAGVSWGEFQGYTGSVKVIGFGYPGANRVGDEEAVDRGFHVAQLDGEIIPGEGRERGSLVFRLSPGQVDDDEFWGGASGAALFDADRQRLIGVVAERLNPWKNRWDLVPVSDFARVEDLPEPVRGQRLWEVQDPDRLIESAYRPRPAQLTDFMRLTARYGYVPYLERSHEEPLEKLLDWCAGDLDSRISISVLTGQAGAGKTRLAAHLCTVLQKDTGSHETNWEAGFARTDRVDGWSRFLPARPTLVVFDYTDRERARASLTAWIRYLNTEADRCPKVRILLVNRHSGGWLQELDAPTEGLASELQRSGHHLDLRKNDEAEGDGFDAEIRREHAHEAYRRFRNAGADDPTPEDLLDFAADERIDSPLLVHIAALLAARDQPLPDRGSGDGDAGELRDELLRMLFERERKRWNEHRALSLTEEPPSNSDEAGHAMAIVNLIQPDRSEVKDYLSASPLWMDARTAERQAAAKALHTLYPGAMRPISENQAVPTVAAMEPDLISEYLLATIDADDLALIVKQLHTLDLYGRHFDRMLHLAALAEDHYEHIRGVLDGTVDRFLRLVVGEDEDASASAPQILATRLDHLVKTAVSKAAETDPQSVPNQLTTALQRYGGHPSVAEAATNLEAKVPFPTPNRQTGELALKLESLAVQNLESADEGPELALHLNLLGQRLNELGRHDEALLHYERALALYEDLAADNPAHLPHLARNHNNLGYGLGELGRHGKALPHHERALALYEDLAADNPAHLPYLARSHHNLGYGLNELGRHGKALPHHERALALYEDLAADNPAHLPHLANSHHNLGYGLNELGRHDEALPHHERALELRKSLAADNPAHLPHLAGSHHNLGYTLTLLSRVAEAHFHHLRAAEIFQQLATDIPVPYAEHYQANRKRANALASQLAKRNKARAAKAKRKGKRKK
ncbi:tetratricopeptide repeat protein [Glycomyces sp. NRRL B-16210]|uniref:tetratricopeptide repeat protein n=1 Tax=Glycomyces sp. NRRL B-16210 TaxID=1463821 RepID=UPI0004BE8E21|nr:tetratricopeptide repeat protein [Glycomyces sp. NRRL B-16210]